MKPIDTVAAFDGVLGHAHPKAVLTAALASDRVAHAYLFHGEAHIGKFLTAAAFAKMGLCARPKIGRTSGRPTIAFCGQCPSCLAIDSGSHPDLRIVRPDGVQIKIGQIRELQDAIAFKPLIGSRKWFLIDDADAMNAEAANCFLKTLEEPPDHSILILVSGRPQALLPTILSRCQSVRFIPPPLQTLSHWLQKERGVGAEEARRLAALSMGRIGVAIGGDTAALKNERDRILGALSKEHLEETSDLFSQSDELAATAEQLDRSLDTIEIWLRDVLIARHDSDVSLLVNQDIPEQVAAWSRAVSTEAVLETLTLIHLLKGAAPRNLNRVLVLETVLLKIRDAVVGESAGDSKAGVTGRIRK
ncbi:MAG TPA: DNA polymerase III subunit delta' [Nitrospiria bacterium]|nr:DNA polymerase III subunit delta' [Nitrospiria bacterium]